MNPTFRNRFRIPSIAVAMLAASAVGIGHAAPQIEPEERGSASVAGIRVDVVADAWTGIPLDMGDVEPLLVTVSNESGHPLRIRYDQFMVIGPGGDREAALPPFEIRGTALLDPAFTPGPYPYSVNGFWVAPYLSRYYPSLRPFGGSFVYDPWYYSTHYPRIARVSLPTSDMLAQALPEGVLEPGGRVTGFVYLEDKPHSGDQSTFVMELVSADTAERFGRVEIPLEVD